MTVTCPQCRHQFDDAARSTICPHGLIMPRADLERKRLAMQILGKEARFVHHPDGPYHRVQSMSWNGMVTVEGFSGEFAPDLLVVKE